MWSGIKCPSSNSTPRWRHKGRNMSPTRFRNFPYIFFLRYLDTNTIWYLQSHLTCDKLDQSCIDNSSCLPFETFPRNYLYDSSPDRQNLSESSTRGGRLKSKLIFLFTKAKRNKIEFRRFLRKSCQNLAI